MLIISLQHNKPIKKVTINANKIFKLIVVVISISVKNKSLKDFPIMMGKQIIKEKADASFLVAPNKRAQQIVAPDLEIPGKIAIA